MRTTVDIEETLLQRLRDQAHQEKVSFRVLLNRVILRGLDAPTSESAARYERPSFSLGAVRDGINLVKALQLSGDLEDEETLRKLARGR